MGALSQSDNARQRSCQKRVNPFWIIIWQCSNKCKNPIHFNYLMRNTS
jgi:hypothetical protein